MRYVVIGAGAIGGVVGAALTRSGHDVALIARGAHGDAIEEHGLHVHEPGGTTIVRPALFRSSCDAGLDSDDVVLVAVKSQDTVSVLDELVDAAPPDVPIACLQNGVHNEREALRRFASVYGTVVMCPTVYLEPGHVIAHSAPTIGIIDVGRFPRGTDATVDTIVGALRTSGFSSEAQPDIERWKWSKLVTNLGNAIEAVCGPDARRGPLGDVVRDEALAVLATAGIDAATADEDRARRGDHLQLQPVDGVRRPGGSSWQSLARGAGSIETDHLNGEIVLLGRLHGVPTPVNERLQREARRLVAGRSEPGAISDEDVLSSATNGAGPG